VLGIRRTASTFDLRLAFLGDGYVPLELPGLEVAPPPLAAARTVALAHGAELHLALEPADTSAFRGHVVFALERGQLEAVSGPYPDPAPPVNERVGGLYLYLDAPQQLLEQRLLLDAALVLRGLAPRHYSLRGFADDFEFTLAEFELRPGRCDVAVAWHAR
jgi:hypothetical protein